MIRIGFVQAWLTVGGVERLVQSLANRLDRSRFEVHLLNLYGPGTIGEQMQAEGWKLVTHLAHGKFDPGAGGRLRRAYEAADLDVVYAHDSALAMFWAGMARRQRPRPRLVLGFHSTGKLGDPVQHFLARRATLPVADRLVALAETHRRFLARELRVPESRFAVIPSGVDLSRFDATLARDEARRAAGLPLGVPLVGIVAALRPEKHHALFLAMAARVLAKLPEARFVIVGDGPARADVEHLLARSGLAGRVEMLGTRQDVARIHRALDVEVLTSHPVVETLPVTLLEAAACGTPIVATDVGSVADVVAHGATGYVVPAGDAAAFAARVLELLTDSARASAFGHAARQRAEARFDEGGMFRAYEALFAEVAAAR